MANDFRVVTVCGSRRAPHSVRKANRFSVSYTEPARILKLGPGGSADLVALRRPELPWDVGTDGAPLQLISSTISRAPPGGAAARKVKHGPGRLSGLDAIRIDYKRGRRELRVCKQNEIGTIEPASEPTSSCSAQAGGSLGPSRMPIPQDVVELRSLKGHAFATF